MNSLILQLEMSSLKSSEDRLMTGLKTDLLSVLLKTRELVLA